MLLESFPGGYLKMGLDVRLEILTTLYSRTTDKPNLHPMLKPNFLFSCLIITLKYKFNRFCNRSLKGVLHPRPVFGLFMHFPQKLQHIGNK